MQVSTQNLAFSVKKSTFTKSVFLYTQNIFCRTNHTFPTDPKSIDAARKWVIDTIEKNSVPPITVKADTLSYSIESTSTYHLPVVQRWGGIPEIVNPKLAGSSHRKTDYTMSFLIRGVS